MGLDIVEFIIAVEGAFGLDIPDHDAARLETPRHLIDYLAARLPVSEQRDTACLSQRAFYRGGGAAARRFGVDRKELLPRTTLRAMMGERHREWKAFGKDVEA